MAKIYVSSTYSDLADYRQAVYRVLREIRQDVIAMEDYVASDERPADRCMADVAACDLYVGLFAWRYGFVPQGYDQSITELELRQAQKSQRPCLIFLVDEGAPWPRNLMDRDPARIEALRDDLKGRFVVSFFKTPDDLATKVGAAVANKFVGESAAAAQRPITLRVYHFENFGKLAKESHAGERISGVVLDQLLKLDADADRAGERLDPVRIWGFRSGPPEDLYQSFRELAPFIMVAGYVEDGAQTGEYTAHIRASFVDKEVRPQPLLSETVECGDSRDSMLASLGDLPARILDEAMRASDRIELLIQHLIASDAAEAEKARDELLRLGPIRQLCELLREARDPAVLVAVLGLLDDLNDRTAAPAVRALLDHPNYEYATRAACMLAQLGDAAAAPVLLAQIQRAPDSSESERLLRLLARLKYEPGVQVVEPLLESSRPEVRRAAAAVLVSIGGEVVRGALVKAAENSDGQTRAQVLGALRAYRDPKLAPLFQRHLSDEFTARTAAEALAEIGDASGAGVLLDDLARATDLNQSSAGTAGALLIALRSREVVPRLLDIIHDGGPIARGYAAEVLVASAGTDAAAPLLPLLSDPEYYPRYATILALGQLRRAEAQPALALGMRDQHPNCRAAALTGYLDAGWPRPEDRETLRSLLGTGDVSVQYFAALGLAMLGDAQGLQALISVVGGTYFYVYKGSSMLPGEDILRSLVALVPAAGDTLAGWAGWVRERAEGLAWDARSRTWQSPGTAVQTG